MDSATATAASADASGPLRHDMLRAGLVYGGGDAVAMLVSGAFLWQRLLLMTLVGALLYAPEIRAWFGWLARRFPAAGTASGRWSRALLAWLWFNPLWIARHALFIRVAEGRWQEIGINLLAIGATAFLVNLPLALGANYLIQNRVPLRWRLTASASFSALMAVYYAMSEVWFG